MNDPVFSYHNNQPAPEVWSGTGRIAWVNDGTSTWLGHLWRDIRSGKEQWRPLETITLKPDPVVAKRD